MYPQSTAQIVEDGFINTIRKSKSDQEFFCRMSSRALKSMHDYMGRDLIEKMSRGMDISDEYLNTMLFSKLVILYFDCAGDWDKMEQRIKDKMRGFKS